MSDIQRCRVKGNDWWLEAADDGPLIRHDDHVEALDNAVSDARARAYTLMGDAIQNGIDNERKRIRFAVGALPLDNSGRVDYADALAAINEEES
jgi:hypothetical protein